MTTQPAKLSATPEPKCPKCGGDTIDYGCWACESVTADKLGVKLAELTRELAAVTKERDVLAEIIEPMAFDTYDIQLPNGRVVVCVSRTEWELIGEPKMYPTAIDAIRAALESKGGGG